MFDSKKPLCWRVLNLEEKRNIMKHNHPTGDCSRFFPFRKPQCDFWSSEECGKKDVF